MADWLTADVVKSTLGAQAATDVDDGALGQYAAGVASYVEDRRPDLWTLTADEPPVPEFSPTPRVVLGAARLAFASYRGRVDPSKAKVPDEVWALLGIRKGRGFRFGGAAPLVVVDEVV